jgi:hypothetical protein
MPTIPNYPQALIDEHMNWHMNPGNPAQGGRAIPAGQPGSGVEFLSFHQIFVGQFHAWYDTQPGNDQGLIAPTWTSVPPELQDPALGWTAALANSQNNIMNSPLSFATADAIGIEIENNIHNWIHGAAATKYNEPNLASPMTGPVTSTYFYKIHGLVENWWFQWQVAIANAEQQSAKPVPGTGQHPAHASNPMPVPKP